MIIYLGCILSNFCFFLWQKNIPNDAGNSLEIGLFSQSIHSWQQGHQVSGEVAGEIRQQLFMISIFGVKFRFEQIFRIGQVSLFRSRGI